MTENDRNMRTLVVCFVLALAVLVPLRVLQGGSLTASQVQVLGETETQEGERMELIYGDETGEVMGQVDDQNSGEVILPDAEVSQVIETEE